MKLLHSSRCLTCQSMKGDKKYFSDSFGSDQTLYEETCKVEEDGFIYGAKVCTVACLKILDNRKDYLGDEFSDAKNVGYFHYLERWERYWNKRMGDE